MIHSIIVLFSLVAWAKPELYVIDVDHSKIGFEVDHLVVSTTEGVFRKFEGKLNFDPDDLSKTTLGGMVEVGSIDTGVKKRDDHLKASDFFDAKKFPKILFQSKKVQANGKELKIIGDLTMRGVTKEVELEGKYRGSAKAFEKTRAAFKFETKVNRKDFGMSFSGVADKGPIVGDEVTITLLLEAIPKGQM